MDEELDDDVAYFLNKGRSGGSAVAEPPVQAPVERPPPTEEEQLADDISYFSRWQPNDIGQLKSQIDTLSRPAQKKLAGFEARQVIDNTPAATRNTVAVATGIGADVTSGPMRLANAVLPDAINPFDKAAPDYVNWMAEETNRIATEKDAENKVVSPWVARGLRGAARTLPVMGLAGRNVSPYAAIASAAAIEGNQALTEGADAGLKGGELYAYAGAQAAIEGGVAAAFQALGHGGLETVMSGKGVVSQGIKQALKQAGGNVIDEMGEEVLTEVGHKLVSRLGPDPNGWTPEGVSETILETIGQTGVTVGLAESPNIASGAVKSVLRKTPPPSAPPQAAPVQPQPPPADPEIQTAEVQPAAPSSEQAAPLNPITPSEAQPVVSTETKGGLEISTETPAKTIGKKVPPVEHPVTTPPPADVAPTQQEAVTPQPTGDIKATPTEAAEIEPPAPVKQGAMAAMEKILQKLPSLDEKGAQSYLSTIDKMLSRGDLPVSEQEMVSQVRKHVVDRWKAAKAEGQKPVAPVAPTVAPPVEAAPAVPQKKVAQPPGPAPESNLTQEEEAALHAKVKAGDEIAKDQFVQHYLPFAKSIAGQYARKNPSIGFDELYQAGQLGLVVAMGKFDPSRGRFTTVADYHVKNAIRDVIKNARKVPLQSESNLDSGALPDNVDPKAAQPSDEAVQHEDAARIAAATLQLPLKQRIVIEGRNRGLSLDQIAEEQGVTKARIGQVSKAADASIKRMMEGKPPRPAKESDNEPFKKTALNKKKGAVVISVGGGHEMEGEFLDDIGAIVQKIKAMEATGKINVPALQNQLGIAKEQAANPLATSEQRKMLGDLMVILKKHVPDEPAPTPAAPKVDPLELLNDAVFQFEQILGRPLQAVQDKDLNEHDRDAGEFAKEFGLTPVFVSAKDGSELPMGGISHGKMVVLRAGMPEESLWEIVQHEVTHGTGLDAKNEFDRKLIQDKADEYYQNVSKQRRESLDEDPAMRMREGAAMLVGEFGRSPSLRKHIREGKYSPGFYEQIRDKILDAVGVKRPKHKAFLETIEHFRQEREKAKGRDPNPSSDPLKQQAAPVKAGSLKDVVAKRVGKEPAVSQDEKLRVSEEEVGPPVSLYAINKIFPGKPVERTKDGYRVQLNGGPLDIVGVPQGAIQISDEAWQRFEESEGRKFSPEERKEFSAAGRFGMRLPDGTMHSGLGVLALTHGIATDATARHEGLHFFRASGMLTEKEWQALVDRYGKPGMSDDAIEEAVASAMGSYKDNRSLWQKVIDWLKSIPQALGWTKLDPESVLRTMSTSDFLDRRARSPLVKADRFAIAWHGTPHKVDKFSTDKVGTGEGAQVYGWGLYFASKRAIGEHYRKALAMRHGSGRVEITLDGQEVEFGNMPSTIGKDGALAVSYVDLNKTRPNPVQEALDQMRSQMDVAKHRLGRSKKNLEEQRAVQSSEWASAKSEQIESDEIRIEQTERAIKWLEERMDRIKVKQPGSLYKVELKPSEDEFLDWDAELPRQPEKIQKAIEKLAADDATMRELQQRGAQMDGSVFYNYLETKGRGKEELQWNDHAPETLEEAAADPSVASSPDYVRGDSWHRRKGQAGPYYSITRNEDGFDVFADDAYIGIASTIDGAKKTAQEDFDARFPEGLPLGPKGASQHLFAVGIKGNKYLDGSSRKIGEGTHNYVIFHDDDVEILERLAIKKKVPPQMQLTGSPEAEQQFSEAEQPAPPSQAKKMLGNFGKMFARQQLHIPNDADHATMNEHFRLSRQHGTIAKENATQAIAAVLKPMKGDKNKLELFTRKTIIDNLYSAVQRGEAPRFGYDLDQNGNQLQDRNDWLTNIQKDKDNLDQLAANDPEVTQAIAVRKGLVAAIVAELQQDGLLNELTPDQIENYFHQQVLDYLQVGAVVGKSPKMSKAGFQMGRTQTDKALPNYNTSYKASELEWLTDAFLLQQKKKWLKDMDKRWGILPQLKAAAKANGTTWQEELRNHPGYKEWHGEDGLQLYKALGVKEKVVADVLAGLAPSANVTKDDIKNITAAGGKKMPMVLPAELVEQLESMTSGKLSDVQAGFEGMANLSRTVLNAAKATYQLGPQAIIPAQIRNLTGDFDKLVGGGAGMALRYLGESRELMYKYYYEQDASDPNVLLARNLGIMDSSAAADDVEDLRKNKWIAPYLKGDMTLLNSPIKATGKYLDFARQIASYRESLFRYAVFRYYQDALRKGTLAHYGAASKAKVDRIKAEMGVDYAAAHLARNLLGDYGNLTVMGNFLRRHLIPFHAWTEITLKSYPQIAANAVAYGKRKVGKSGAASAGLSAAALAAIAAPYALMHLWNNMFWGDDEEKLSAKERAMPHIITGHNADGSIRLLRNAGAFGDFLEQFGLVTAISRWNHVAAGQMTSAEVASEAGWQILARHITSIRPEAKIAIESLKGSPLYPNPWGGTKRPLDEMAMANTGFPDTYRELKGRAMQAVGAGDGTRARPHAMTKAVIGVSDPRKNALYEILELRDRFLDKLGQERAPRDRRTVNMQAAAEDGDLAAFKEARLSWLTTGTADTRGSYEKFRNRIEALDPLDRLNQSAGQDVRFTKEYLTADQRLKLRLATEYGADTREKMVLMWNDAEKSDPPEVKAQLKQEKMDWLVTRSARVTKSFPESLGADEAAEASKQKIPYAEALARKQQKWASNRKDTIQAIKSSGIPLQEIVEAIRTKEMAEVDSVGGKEKSILRRRQARSRATDLREKHLSEFVDAVISNGS